MENGRRCTVGACNGVGLISGDEGETVRVANVRPSARKAERSGLSCVKGRDSGAS